MPVPWRIAEQTVALADENGEPVANLVFVVDHQNASEVKLRMVSADKHVVEMTFTTGGYLIGKPEHLAPPPPAEAAGEPETEHVDETEPAA